MPPPRDGRHRPGTPALPHTQVAPSVRWNGGERPSPLLLCAQMQRFLNQPTVEGLFNKCEKCDVKDTLGFQLGDRVRKGIRGRNSKKKDADYGVVIHIKPDDTHNKKPGITILWRRADGNAGVSCFDKETQNALNQVQGYKNGFNDVHTNDKSPPAFPFTYEELVTHWCAIPSSPAGGRRSL